MSEQQAPDRTIRGFGAARGGGGVRPDARRLLARNRTTNPAALDRSAVGSSVTEAPAEEPAASATAARPVATTPDPAPAVATQSVTASATGTRPEPVKAQVNVMVPTDLRGRIRSAYRATAAREGHRSFSDFVAHLLELEAQRLEGRYNDGQRFHGGQQPLSPGRPLDS